MKKSNILILAVIAILMFPYPAHSQNGPDPVRAGMFKLYAKTATKALVAQDAVLTLNGGEHIMSKEEVDKINNFQKQFNKYLTFTFSCPANTLAVALSKSRSHIYSDIIDNGIQIAADVEKLLPISKDEDKNSKMTEKERIDCISRVRKSLQSMNYKIRKLNRLLRYTTLMDSWYELRGKYYKPKSMYTISTECQKRWARKARGVMN